MRTLILQNCKTETLGLYERSLADRGLPYDVVHTYRQSPPAPEGYDMILVGGTPDAAYNQDEVPYLARVYRTLAAALDAGKSCFGVCCGAQLLAQLLGASVHRNPAAEIGGYEVTLTAEGQCDPLLEGFPERFPVFHWHADTFEMPSSASLLAVGEKCRNQLFRRGNVVGVQFHLEITADDARQWAARYMQELAAVDKKAEDVIAECREREPRMRRLAFKLLENYLDLIG